MAAYALAAILLRLWQQAQARLCWALCLRVWMNLRERPLFTKDVSLNRTEGWAQLRPCKWALKTAIFRMWKMILKNWYPKAYLAVCHTRAWLAKLFTSLLAACVPAWVTAALKILRPCNRLNLYA